MMAVNTSNTTIKIPKTTCALVSRWVDWKALPSAEAVRRWSSGQYVAALRHDQKNPAFNPNVRQLLHVGYKIAGKLGKRYLDALEACEASVARNVTENLYERHVKPLFLNGAA